MKFYKLENTRVAEARHNDPLECVFADGTYSFYMSETDEVLGDPFMEVDGDMPASVTGFIENRLDKLKEDILEDANVLIGAISFFKSSVLGKEYTYDMGEEDQLNLGQAITYLSLIDGTVKIRCTDAAGVKDNVEHTKEQVTNLFKDWYLFKSNILNKYSTLKIDISKAKTEAEAKLAFEAFKKDI